MSVTWVSDAGFSLRGIKRGHRHWRAPHGQSNGIAVGGAGKAWVAGWWVSNDYWGYWNPGIRRIHAKGLPMSIPKGWAAIFVINPRTGVTQVIHAPASGPLTGIALSKNFVWTIDPYRRCRRRNEDQRCKPPELLQYNLTTNRFAEYVIPHGLPVRPTNDVYYRTPMAVGPDGSVWTVLLSAPKPGNGPKAKRRSPQLILLRFRDGRFSSAPLWHAGLSYYFDFNFAPTPRRLRREDLARGHARAPNRRRSGYREDDRLEARERKPAPRRASNGLVRCRYGNAEVTAAPVPAPVHKALWRKVSRFPLSLTCGSALHRLSMERLHDCSAMPVPITPRYRAPNRRLSLGPTSPRPSGGSHSEDCPSAAPSVRPPSSLLPRCKSRRAGCCCRLGVVSPAPWPMLLRSSAKPHSALAIYRRWG